MFIQYLNVLLHHKLFTYIGSKLDLPAVVLSLFLFLLRLFIQKGNCFKCSFISCTCFRLCFVLCFSFATVCLACWMFGWLATARSSYGSLPESHRVDDGRRRSPQPLPPCLPHRPPATAQPLHRQLTLADIRQGQEEDQRHFRRDRGLRSWHRQLHEE